MGKKQKKEFVYEFFVSTTNEKIHYVAIGQKENAEIESKANAQRFVDFMTRIGKNAGNDHFDFKSESKLSGRRRGGIRNTKTIKGQCSIDGTLYRHIKEFAVALIQNENDEKAVESVLHLKEKAEKAKQRRLEQQKEKEKAKQKRKEQYQFFGIVKTTGKNKVAYFFEDDEEWIEDDLFHGLKEIPTFEYEEGVELADNSLIFDQRKIKRGEDPVKKLGLSAYKIVDNQFDVFAAASRK